MLEKVKSYIVWECSRPFGLDLELRVLEAVPLVYINRVGYRVSYKSSSDHSVSERFFVKLMEVQKEGRAKTCTY